MISLQKNLVWVCAGSDSFGAAGVQADIKTLTRFDAHAATVITAITAQSPLSCQSIHAMPRQQVVDQFNALISGPVPKAIKVGMISSREAFDVLLANCNLQKVPVILDPVLKSTSGSSLVGDLNPKEILSLAKSSFTVLTPNVPEAEALSGLRLNGPEDFPQSAAALIAAGAACVVIKGGHSHTGSYVYDYYASRDGQCFFMRAPRHSVKNLRGTGCTFASAVAGGIAQGLTPEDAVVLAKAYMNQCFSTAQPGEPSIISYKDPVRCETFMPEILTFSDTNFPGFSSEYRKSPEHKTGFYVIADSATWVKKLAAWGVPTIQLRVKNLKGAALIHEIAAAVEAVRGTHSALYINDYWQEAIAAGAFGVHLGQEDLLEANIQAIKDAGLRLGISTHSWLEAAVAQTIKPSYIALGPIFPTSCKSMRFGPQGFKKLREWVAAWNTPVVAIGGLSLGHARELKQSLCAGVAVVSDVLAATDPQNRVKDWMKALAN